MTSGSRRPHTKSRNGCAQCKARRVRCNCVGPICSNCRRRKEQCSFLAASSDGEQQWHQRVVSPASTTNTACSRPSGPGNTLTQVSLSVYPLPPHPFSDERPPSWLAGTAAAAPVQQPEGDMPATTAQPSSKPGPPQEPGYQPPEQAPVACNIPMEISVFPSNRTPEQHTLLLHFLQNTASSLILAPSLTSPQRWHTKIYWPAVLASHPYVLESVVSLSALHMCHLEPPDTSGYYSAACSNFLLASKGFRQTVASVDDSNWLPTLLFSVSVLVYHFYIPFAGQGRVPQNPVPESTKDFNPLEVLFILRTAGSLLNNIGPLLLKAGLVVDDPNSPWIRSEHSGPRMASWDEEMNDDIVASNSQRFNSLMNIITESSISDKEKAESFDALSHLRKWAHRIHGQPRTWKDFQMWPQKVLPGFLQQIALRRRPALALLNQWCLIMKQGPDPWYLTPWLDKVSSTVTPSAQNEDSCP
ncbi:uncharacterized protein MKZ38_000460 [Zalerion maritima]|uniref:Zn(2)-C6 fungal-type domain-containing protein n=1 Tax=Zalerion maritima TaxID=339359 RepID=A0AAD5WY89_9PEZI|nr:uncharacterized protein MKZ38_000460 [Zalerion maritima]